MFESQSFKILTITLFALYVHVINFLARLISTSRAVLMAVCYGSENGALHTKCPSWVICVKMVIQAPNWAKGQKLGLSGRLQGS